MTRKIIFSIIISLLITTQFYSAKKSNSNVQFEIPKNVVIISSSGSGASNYVTVIDLSNNEIVILEYATKYPGATGNGELLNVIRTGMIVDLSKQEKISLKQ